MNEDSKNQQVTSDDLTIMVQNTDTVEAEEALKSTTLDQGDDEFEKEATDERHSQETEQDTGGIEEEAVDEGDEEVTSLEADERKDASQEGEADAPEELATEETTPSEVGEPNEVQSTEEVSPPEASMEGQVAANIAATPASDVADIDSLEEAYDNSLRAFTEGKIARGAVINVDRDEVMVDIGFKSEGYIPVSEFEADAEGLPSVSVGDEIDVYIVRREDADGQLILSKEIADQKLVWDEITKAYEEGQIIEGKITQRIKGGLQVDVGKLRAFLPASQVELRPVRDFDQYIGQTLEMKVVKLSKRRRNIVLSRRVILEDELASRKAELLDTLEAGQIRTGVVKNITTFGAFVDLGGIDGLLHKSDMSWGRVNHPSEVVSVGDEIDVMVIAVDREHEKVSLGLKQKTRDPWEAVEEKYPIGSTVKGEVVSIVNYGAFLELEEGVEGLIHISEMSWTRRNVAPSKIVKRGEIIEAIVLDIDKDTQKLSLGLKQLHANPWELLETKYPVGTKVVGRVRNLTDFGAFVEIEEGIDGLIHVSDLSWVKRVVNPREILNEDDEVEVMVLSIDPSEQKVSLGLKQIEPDPWIQVPEKYKIGSVVRGKIVNLTSFGAFAQLEDGIEGLIHISELADRRIERPEEVVSIGSELELKVIHLDPTERRIGLSLKAAQAEQERAAIAQYQQEPRKRQPEEHVDEEMTVLGALLKEELDKSGSEG